MKFGKWKKEIKSVHKEHVKNMLVLNNPKSSEKKKIKAKDKLKDLENVEMYLESTGRNSFNKLMKPLKKRKD